MTKRDFALIATLVIFGACHAHPPGPVDAGADLGDATGPPACNGSPLRAYAAAAGALERLFIEMPLDGVMAPFVLDTGSPGSYAYGQANDAGTAAFIPDAGGTSISCFAERLAFLPQVAAQTPDGDAVAGTLGTDLIGRGMSLDLRVAEKRMVWTKDRPDLGSGATLVPLDFRPAPDSYPGAGWVVASGVKLDGKEVQLVVDTGSPNMLIISSTPRANEVMIPALDALGNPVTLYESTIELRIGEGPPRVVPVDRAEHFPMLEELIAAIGGGPMGLLGLGVLGDQRIALSADRLAFVAP
jgi:hypothetical protein